MKAALLLSGFGAICGSFMLVTMLAVLNALGPGAPREAPAYARDTLARHHPTQDRAPGITSAFAQTLREQKARIVAGG